jgi:predicted RNA-binding protein with PIN domain
MPHIIVDGYNCIRRIPRFLSAESRGLESGRYALLIALEDYAARHGYEVTVVFDGANRSASFHADVPRQDTFAGIDILFSGRGQSADAAIIELVQTIRREIEAGERTPGGGEIVVTDDFGIRDEVIELGAFVKSTAELFAAMESGERLLY